MSFYFKLLILVMLIFSSQVFYLDLQGLYLTSCQRKIGVILDVDKNYIYHLSLDGKVELIPRYDIVGVARYPINHIPIDKIQFSAKMKKKINLFKIKTKYNNKMVDLVTEWPIAFSKEKIAFLDQKGSEIVVQRRNIWSIDILSSKDLKSFNNIVEYKYDFITPRA